MRLRHIKDSEINVLKCSYVVDNARKYFGKWNEVFCNNNKIELEIGMGKGDFIIKKAISNPNINYIGLEKYASVVLFAIKKLENLQLSNLKIIVMDALYLNEVFDKEISKIYLNFSDPWPKSRHEKRRLTSSEFLSVYDKIFKFLKVIEQKTDNDDLFLYSLKSFKKNRYFVVKKSVDYRCEFKTEYEKKFIKCGKNINYVKVVKII